MQALAAANAAFNFKQAGDAIAAGQGMVPTTDKNPDESIAMKEGNAADKVGGISVSLSVGASSSRGTQDSRAEDARGSRITAGGNVSIQTTGAVQDSNMTVQGSAVQAGGNAGIQATGDGQASNLTVQGSAIQAGGTATLKADNDVRILAAQNTTSERNSQRSQSGSIGIGASLGNTGSSNGSASVGVTVSASVGRGQGAGNSTTHTNSQISGSRVVIDSGGDTVIKGGLVKGDQISAKVGGDLVIESLQDTATYQDKSTSAGGAVTIGPSSGGSINLAASKINSDYRSVGEQSAIRAGDGGFQVAVKGDTALTGGQITSSQAAIDNDKNRFQTGGTVTTTDLHNSARYEGQSLSLGVGTGTPKPGASPGAGLSGMGIGHDSDSANSVTTAGISGIAGNTNARTGDRETGIAQIFNKDQIKAEVAAQVAITSEFGKQASKFGGTEADKQRDALKAQARQAQANGDPKQAQALQAEAAKWDEGGAYRVAMHTVIGGLTGGVQGAVGAGAASAAAPTVDQLQGQLKTALTNAGLGETAANAVSSLASGATAATIGAAASGGSVAGAATAFNADMNNRQLHPDQIKGIQKLSSDPKKQGQLTAVLCVLQNCDVNGLSGYDANGKGIYEAGRLLQASNPPPVSA